MKRAEEGRAFASSLWEFPSTKVSRLVVLPLLTGNSIASTLTLTTPVL